MRRYRRRAVPEVSPWLACPPETMVICRYRRSAVPEVCPWLPSPPETKVTCRYRRRAVVEGACRQVTCVTTMSAWMYMDEENFAATQNFHATKRNQMKWKHRRFAFANLRCLSGDGEIRTLVQTWNQYAFYMLSFDLVFDRGQDQNYQPKAYLLKSRTATGEQAVPAPILLAPPYRNVSEQGNRVMSRFCHCGRNKANLLCFG